MKSWVTKEFKWMCASNISVLMCGFVFLPWILKWSIHRSLCYVSLGYLLIWGIIVLGHLLQLIRIWFLRGGTQTRFNWAKKEILQEEHFFPFLLASSSCIACFKQYYSPTSMVMVLYLACYQKCLKMEVYLWTRLLTSIAWRLAKWGRTKSIITYIFLCKYTWQFPVLPMKV